MSMSHQNLSPSRMSKFGSGAIIVRSRGDDPLTLAEIEARTPSVFAVDKHESRSERFTYVPTIDVLGALAQEGFHPYEVRQGGSRDVAKRAFTKHLVKLRKVGARPSKVGDSVREVLLLNAHDGTSSYQLMSGLFRLVCLNGMIVSDGQAQHVRIPHKGDIIHEVIDAAYTIVDDGARIDKAVENMQHIELSVGEQNAYAEAALHLRYAEDEVPALDPRRLLHPRRMADQGSDLWRSFNRVQENLEHGGIAYNQRSETTRRIAHRHTRPVNSIDGSVALNRALWTLTEKLRELKA